MVLLRAILVCLVLPLVATSREPVTTLAELRALPVKEAASGVPVRIEGVVLGLEPMVQITFFMHDVTAGCAIHRAGISRSVKLVPGDKVRVEGKSEVTGFYPTVGNAVVTHLGKGEYPEPLRPGAGGLFAPLLDSQWVEVPVVVTGYESTKGCFTLDLEVHGMPFKAEMPAAAGNDEKAASLLQRPALLRGVMATVFNRHRQMTDRSFHIASCDAIIPVMPPAGGGTSPLLKVTQLLTGGFGPDVPVRIQGTVTQTDSKGFYLRDASGSTLVQAAHRGEFPPGTVVEAEGFGAVSPFRPILRAVRIKKMGGPEPIDPVAFNFQEHSRMALHAERVKLDAEFIGSQTGGTGSILHFRSGPQFFETIHPSAETGLPFDLGVGDRVRLTGICELTTTHHLPRYSWVDGFRIHLPETGGVEIVRRAPWWTLRRLYIALGLMSGAAVLGILGTWMLRRQVKRQMAVIGGKLRSEAVGAERDRMARELHDTLEQQLSGMALQLAVLDDVVKQNPAASPVLSLARQMLRHTRVEARRSVWDLRSKVLQNEGLEAALQAIADHAVVPAGTGITVRVLGDRRTLPSKVDFHLLRIAQEATTNAIKHGNASAIRIELEYSPDKTCLTVQDDGCGFDAAAFPVDSGSHFGLLGMTERAEKIGAALAITSLPGQGCTVTVTVPNPAKP